MTYLSKLCLTVDKSFHGSSTIFAYHSHYDTVIILARNNCLNYLHNWLSDAKVAQ